MKPISLQQIRQAIGGKSVAPLPAEPPQVSGVFTNSKEVKPASIFVALRGERFDGHVFLKDAALAGAIAAVVDHVPKAAPESLHLLQVPDTRVALGKLATLVRKQLRAKVIAVAGSNGKTGTKYLIQSALSAKLKGTFSPKSFNNDIGVPLTVFAAEASHDYLVLEMGTNHHGEIRTLTMMAQPDIVVITNIGPEHLEFLDDLMGVRRENASIIEGLNPAGLLVVNGDDEDLLTAVAAYPGKRLTFGFKESNDLFASDVVADENGVRFRLNNSRREITIPLLGKHTACNSLAAIAVARALRLSEDVIAEGLATAQGPDMRLQVSSVRGITLINDAYNANPASMKAALETLAGLVARGRRIAVLGDMRELGVSSERLHREIGEFAATCKLDALACIGPSAALIADAAEQAPTPPGTITRFSDAPTAAKIIPGWLREGDMVLLKASRAMRLEAVANALAESEAGVLRKAAS